MSTSEEAPLKPPRRKRARASLAREATDFVRQLLDDMAAVPRDIAALFRRGPQIRAPRLPAMPRLPGLPRLPSLPRLPRLPLMAWLDRFARSLPGTDDARAMVDRARGLVARSTTDTVADRAAPPNPAVARTDGAPIGAGALKTAGRQGVMAAVGLQKSFKARQVVQGVTLGVRRGEAVGLLGPNGAGKTTCFYMITGLIKPDAGRIELDGHDITDTPMYRRARLGIGYLPQEASIFRGLSVENNIRAVLEIVEPSQRERERQLDALLDEFSIAHLRKLPSIALSGGERRRCEIARALATRPSFMLLDEPFAGIDPIAVGDIQQLVRHLTKRGIGVLITDHNVRETLGLIDRAYIIASGRVLTHGSPDEVVLNPDVRRTYLGEQFTL